MPDSVWIVIAAAALLLGLVIARTAWRRRRQSRLIPFHLPYGCNPAQVVEAVSNAIATTPVEGLAVKPKPRCLILEFYPSHITFAVLASISDPRKEQIAVSDVLMRVHFALQRLGTPLLATSQSVERPRVEAPPKPAAESTIDKYSRILRGIPIFGSLPEEAFTRLAPSLNDALFAPGDYIVRQGDPSGDMYVVVRGAVDVTVDGEGGKKQFVAKLEAGQFFGELSVFTGERRTANVIATTPVECLVVDKPSLMALFDWRPELAEDIAQVITSRQAGLAASVERLDTGQPALAAAGKSHGHTLQRIQNYFGIGTQTGS